MIIWCISTSFHLNKDYVVQKNEPTKTNTKKLQISGKKQPRVGILIPLIVFLHDPSLKASKFKDFYDFES